LKMGGKKAALSVVRLPSRKAKGRGEFWCGGGVYSGGRARVGTRVGTGLGDFYIERGIGLLGWGTEESRQGRERLRGGLLPVGGGGGGGGGYLRMAADTERLSGCQTRRRGRAGGTVPSIPKKEKRSSGLSSQRR